MCRLIAVLVVAAFLTAACASNPPPEKGVDKEGVRQRAGEAGQKLEREERR